MVIGYFLLLSLCLIISQQSPDPPTRYSLLKQLGVNSENPPLIKQSIDGEYVLMAADSSLTVYKNNVAGEVPTSKAGRVRKYNFEAVGTWTEGKNNITAIGGSHDLRVFAAAHTDNKLKVYNKTSGKDGTYNVIQVIDDAKAEITHVVFIANDKILVMVSLDGTVNIYWKQEVVQGDRTQTRKSSVEGDTSNDKENKKAAEEPKYEYKPLQTIESRNKVESIAYSANNTMLYIGFSNRSMTAHKFSAPSKYEFSYMLSGFADNIRSIALNQDGNILALAAGSSVVIYKPDVFGLNPKPVQGIYDANLSINMIALRRDGGVLIATSAEGSTRVYNSYDGRYLLNDTWATQLGPKLSNSLSLDGQILVLSVNKKILIYQSCITSMSKCSQCLSQSKCYGCVDNYFLAESGQCHTCSLFQGCRTCVTENMCTSCYAGYFLNIEIGVCESCTNSLKNCKACSSRYACTECFLEFDLVNDACEFPPNPNIPTPTPIGVTKPTPSHDIYNDKTRTWMVTLIALIIVLCILIITMLIVMTVLCMKLFKKLKSTSFGPKMMYAKGKEQVPVNSERTLAPRNMIKDEVSELKQPTEKNNAEPAKAQPNGMPVGLEPEEKEQDQFTELRP